MVLFVWALYCFNLLYYMKLPKLPIKAIKTPIAISNIGTPLSLTAPPKAVALLSTAVDVDTGTDTLPPTLPPNADKIAPAMIPPLLVVLGGDKITVCDPEMRTEFPSDMNDPLTVMPGPPGVRVIPAITRPLASMLKVLEPMVMGDDAGGI